ncbi:hypothetical protein PGTUg99_024325 [Puccinia graminis f. sp. tritici]|uniref:Uncharacterized protein n=1 Tax=Puccinia graminis f. sp. tritici TaxID=56615 RepID=A0A5B0RZN5_PUCGR|nr:hypothetical protein PGTUg99_024325 [Puccinia graminis f. sp. tritici]
MTIQLASRPPMMRKRGSSNNRRYRLVEHHIVGCRFSRLVDSLTGSREEGPRKGGSRLNSGDAKEHLEYLS